MPGRWSILHTPCVANLPLGLYGGRGARLPLGHVRRSHALVTDTSHAQGVSFAKTTVTLSRLATITRNGKNFRNAEASRHGFGPHSFVQTIDIRHDTDDDDDEACGGNQDVDTVNKIHGVIDDGCLSKRLVPSSALRKFFPILVFREDTCEHSWCRICIANVGARNQTHGK